MDGGGLFKDFLSALVEEAFDPVKTGLFVETPDRTLYPNPASERAARGGSISANWNFWARCSARRCTRGFGGTSHSPGFSSAKLRDGRPSELNDLATLDPELYRHLLSLKRLPAEQVEDLALFFTRRRRRQGRRLPRRARPGRRGPPRHRRKSRTVRPPDGPPSAARADSQTIRGVRRGFRSLVPPAWVRIFAPAELRLLDGAGGRVDVENLRRCATYKGGYTEEHPTVRMLWETLAEFTEEQQRSFLKFVTACPNTPLLGFSQLALRFARIDRACGAGRTRRRTPPISNDYPPRRRA